jgi:hypothetical protein
MQLKKREVQHILDKLEMDTRTTHHVIAWFTFEGQKVLKTRISFGKGDIPSKVTHKLRGQLKLSQADFIALRDCPLDRDGYIAILKEKGLLPE